MVLPTVDWALVCQLTNKTVLHGYALVISDLGSRLRPPSQVTLGYIQLIVKVEQDTRSPYNRH